MNTFYFCMVVTFLAGGVVGAISMFVVIANEMDKGPKIPWRARFIFWRWYHRLIGSKSFETIARNADKARRELFGVILFGVMADLEGPCPIPRSTEATDAVLAEAERRYQFQYGVTAKRLKKETHV